MGHDHGHSHGHDHGHAHHHSGSSAVDRKSERKRLLATMLITGLIMLVEIAGGLYSHSLSLLQDAGHMLSDVMAQGLSLAALVIATRPADARRTYGWYRIEILAALVNGLTLIVLSAVILWKSWLRLHAPVEIHTNVMMVTAGIGLLANLAATRLLHGLTSLNARGAYLHVVLDTLSSFAVLGGGLVMFVAHGLYWVDPVLSLLIGAFVLYSAYALIRDAVDVLLEAVPRGIDLAGVTHALDRVEGVCAVHDLHIWTITSGLYALSAHIVVREGHSDGNDALLNRVQQMLLHEFHISHTTLQIESEDHKHVGHIC